MLCANLPVGVVSGAGGYGLAGMARRIVLSNGRKGTLNHLIGRRGVCGDPMIAQII